MYSPGGGAAWAILATFDSAKAAQGGADSAPYVRRMENEKVALVSGANKGIGLEITKQLAERGYTVLLGTRDLDRGRSAARGIGGDIRAIQLDVTRPESIAAALAKVRAEHGRLDVLVNNAGIARASDAGGASLEVVRSRGLPSSASIDEVREIFETNVFGVIALTQAALPLLRESPAGRIVNVSSSLGSLASVTAMRTELRGIGGVAYGPSKSALNAITVAFAQELEGTPIKVNAVCPGFTATELNGFSGTRSVTEAAREPVRLAMLPADGPTGTLSNDAGQILW